MARGVVQPQNNNPMALAQILEWWLNLPDPANPLVMLEN